MKWDHLLESYHRGEFYQGTSLAYAKSIVRKGLIPGAKPGSFGGGLREKVSYLTGNFELAARYAWEYSRKEAGIPVVMEIHISGPRRIASLTRDPMDDPDTAWSEDNWGENSGWQEAIIEFFEEIEAHARDNWGVDISRSLPNLYDPNSIQSQLKGYNLYKDILIILRRNFSKSDVDMHYAKFKKAFPAGDNAYDNSGMAHIEITRDGTLRLTTEHFQDLHQIMYPKKLPPPAIKYVWVPEYLVKGKHLSKLAVSRQEYEVTRLPHEARGLLDDIKYDNERFKEMIDKAEDEDDIREVRSEILDKVSEIQRSNDPAYAREYSTTIWDDPKWQGGYKPLLDQYFKDKDLQSLQDEAENIYLGIEQHVKDNWNNQDFASFKVKLVKVKSRDLRRL